MFGWLCELGWHSWEKHSSCAGEREDLEKYRQVSYLCARPECFAHKRVRIYDRPDGNIKETVVKQPVSKDATP